MQNALLPRRRCGLFLLCIVIVQSALLSACGRLTEPPGSPALIVALESMAAETDALAAAVPGPRAGRETYYKRLDQQAIDAIALAETREETTSPQDPGRYHVATAGFLTDFRETLAKLDGEDGAEAKLPVMRLRITALQDTLDDALFYERMLVAREYAPVGASDTVQ